MIQFPILIVKEGEALMTREEDVIAGDESIASARRINANVWRNMYETLHWQLKLIKYLYTVHR